MKIALLAGGDSPEREVSLGSAAQVMSALDATKYDVSLVDVRGGVWMCGDERVDLNDFSLGGERFDYALVLIHGTPGEDGRVQGYLDMVGVPYSTCGMVSSVVTFDKQLCKRMVESAGVATAREVFLQRGESVDTQVIIDTLGLPVFVKPNASGSSFGVTKVKRAEDLRAAIDAAFAESDEVLVEEFLDGREIACGLMYLSEKGWGNVPMRNGGDQIIALRGHALFPLTEIISHNEFFDYEAKYTAGGADEVTPADLDPATADKVREMAMRAYRACRCRGLVRIDFMVLGDGRPVMIEVNSIPGMSAGSIVPKQAANAGMSLGTLFDLIIAETHA
jgi:D-alanine-D-alanine ligase